MLSRIFIQNFALIDQLEISLHKGLQVITGETGAGKSIILGALRLILGDRADVKGIQNADSKSVVEAEFSVSENFKDFFDENDLDYEAQTIIRREISAAGKSRAFINDVPVTLDVLKEFSSCLIDIHAQFQTAALFNAAYQFSIIDGIAKNRQTLDDYRNSFARYSRLKQQLATEEKRLAEHSKESDYQSFLLAELQEENLDSVDFEELKNRLSAQENAGAIAENLSAALSFLSAEEVGALKLFSEARSRLSKTADLSPAFAPLSQRFENQYIELKDFIAELEAESEKVTLDPLSLQELSAKADKINALLLKHKAANFQELITIRDALAGDRNRVEAAEENIAETKKEISETEKKLRILAEKLALGRKKSVPFFVEKMQHLLQKIGLEKAAVDIELKNTAQFSPFGNQEIQILFRANPGFPMKPIQEAISGGERSRVMLAVKKIMAENTELPTLILDEIDTGVSGKIADEMGKLMKDMSRDMQLIVITHLAQVAAKGDNNYKVVKKEVSGKTRSDIVPLSSDEKLTEIAALLSGSKITDAALSQARELMN